MQNFKLSNSSYGYSAVNIGNLGASEYTLVSILVDVSGSVSSFKDELEKTIKSIIESCKLSPRVDNLMIRLLSFSTRIKEIHGFKLLSECDLKDYDNCLRIGDMTSLFDALHNAIEATIDYGKQLTTNDFDTNAIVIVITDGEDNSSTRQSENTIKDLINGIQKAEEIESLVTILVGVGVDKTIDNKLNNVKNDAKLSQYINIGEATPNKLAKLANFVSKSISTQSKSLGSGSASNLLIF